ncbi:hypothetical protein BDV59DRAFT_209080 [Aspergillus ambiguus]|uniref:uncharacterized protein n=1 Tax=Aspergillus ambiguus TaxID=176160 RepID=UPI003CCD4102
MPLSIHLERRLASYSGGERILGKVVFESQRPVELEDITVTFSGRAKAKVQKVKGAVAPSASYKSKCVLFEKRRILLHLSGSTLVPGCHEWPFEFMFPSHVQCSARWPDTLPFRSDAEHPLPPTFAAETGDSLRRLDCAIDYRIRAQVFKPQKNIFKKSPLFDEMVRLNFIPQTARLEADSPNSTYRDVKEQLFTVRSLLLLPENRGRSLKLQEKMQSWLSPSQLPRFDFQIALSYSTRMVQSEPLDCILDIVPFMEYSSISFPPEVILQSLAITVVGRTAARAAPSLMGAISGEIDERMEVLCKHSLGMPVSGQVNLGQMFGPLAIKSSDVSFSTFNIARLYRLCATFSFECAGKILTFSQSDLPISIMADGPARDSKDEKPMSGEMRHEDAPPSYTSVSILSTTTFEKR